MLWTALTIVALILAVLFVGRYGPDARKASESGVRKGPPNGLLAERGDALGHDEGDERRGLKLADDLALPIHFRYVNADGKASERAVMIDGVYGDSLDAPRFIRGLDSNSREVRTFRVDRIVSVNDGNRGLTDDVGWWIGNLVRHHLGEATSRPPYSMLADLPIALAVEHGSRPVESISGRIVEITRQYSGAGAVVDITVADDASKNSRLSYIVRVSGPTRGRRLIEAHDPETGEIIPDVEQWVLMQGQRR